MSRLTKSDIDKYLKTHLLPQVYEAILSSMVIMCPEDPLPFIIEKLKYIKEKGYDIIEWDMFIVAPYKRVRLIPRSYLELIFDLDDRYEPTPEQYQKACKYYNLVHMSVAFRAMMQFYLLKKAKKERKQAMARKALEFWRLRKLRVCYKIWHEWLSFCKGRNSIAFSKIQFVSNCFLGHIIFDAWHQVTMDAKRTREYFERLERGDQIVDEDHGHESGEARDDVSLLPKHIAMKMFSNLDVVDLMKCAGVCRSWKVLSQASQLWNKLDLSAAKYKLTDRPVQRILGRTRPFLIQLNLRQCSLLTEISYKCVGECRNLQDLNISECSAVTDETLKYIIDGCKILLYLNISFNNITDASMRNIGKALCNLQYLSIASCNYLTNKGLQYLSLGSGAVNLMYLDMSANPQFTVEGYKCLNKCIKLHSLLLQSMYTLEDECLKAIGAGCKQLQYLSLLGSHKITEIGLKAILVGKNLKKLKISGSSFMTDSVFKMTNKQQSVFSDLRHLYLTNCISVTDNFLKALSNCRSLTVLNIADCIRITDTGVRFLVEGSCGSKLRELNLTNCLRVGDMAVMSLHKKCINLNYLNLSFLEHITDVGMDILGNFTSIVSLNIQGCNCSDQELTVLGGNKSLIDLTLSECFSVTDLGLQKFAQQCQYIQRLDLSFCYKITDAAIKSLAFSCRIVTYLNLAGCKLLTDLSIQYISGVCTHLEHLDISGSLHISDKGLKYLKRGCKKLRYLNMKYCKNVTRISYMAFVKSVDIVEFSNIPPPTRYGYEATGELLFPTTSLTNVIGKAKFGKGSIAA